MKMRLDEWELLDCCHEDGEKKLSVDQNTDFNFRSISVSDRQRTIRDEQEIGAEVDEDAVSQVSGKKLIADRKTDFDFSSISVSDLQQTIRDEQEISQASGKKMIGDMKKLCSARFSDDRTTASDLRSISDSDQQRTIRDEQEIGAQDEEDAVSQVSGQKLIGDMKKESARLRTGAESVERRQKLGIAAICSFGIAVAATICSAVGKP